MSNDGVLFEGYLNKQGDVGLFKSWKTRWFRLKESGVEYSVDKGTIKMVE